VINRALSEFNPDVVIASGWSLRIGIEMISWALTRHVPIVILSESNEFDEPRMPLIEFIKRRVIALCSASLVGGNSHSAYLLKLGMSGDRIYFGHNVIDNLFFSGRCENLRGLRLVDEDDLVGQRPYFLACSRFSGKKNLVGLIRAYSEYRVRANKQNADVWELRLLGDGDERSRIQFEITSLGLDENVILHGATGYSELPRFYAHAGAFVHASTTEQWGLVVNEAMACGLPVLVSNRCGCAPDLVKEGVNGWTFDPLDEAALAGLLERIAALDEGERARMGQGSREIIADWGPERFASGLKAAAEKAIELGPKRAGLIDRMLLKMLATR
jgi:glycosyltransferase involved in cell wall biosynthesis